jgi:hypothetical protein
MVLPQKDLKAKDLDRNLLPNKQVLKAYEQVGHEYEKSCHDRVWDWWYAQVTGKESIRNQPIEQRIDQMMRQKDKNGEWLTYHISLFANNWKGNRVDFAHLEGKIESYPIFHNDVDPQTDEIVPGTTQVQDMKTIYTIPFTSKRIQELSPYFSDTITFTIKAREVGGRRYSCTLEEFQNMPYDDLVNLKAGFTDYMKWKLANRQGGVIER